MTQPTPIADDLVSFANRVRDYADANRLPMGAPIPPIDQREHLCFKVRVDGWETALIYWYFVHHFEGAWWRHLMIQVSTYSHLGEPLSQGEINAYKTRVLEMFERQVRVFFPLHDEVHFKFDVRPPVPVANPASRQVSYRTPMAFHFLVGADSGDGMVGTPSTGPVLGGGARAGGLVDAHGRPFRRTSYDNVATTAPAATPQPVDAGPMADNVLPFTAERGAARSSPPAPDDDPPDEPGGAA